MSMIPHQKKLECKFKIFNLTKIFNFNLYFSAKIVTYNEELEEEHCYVSKMLMYFPKKKNVKHLVKEL